MDVNGDGTIDLNSFFELFRLTDMHTNYLLSASLNPSRAPSTGGSSQSTSPLISPAISQGSHNSAEREKISPSMGKDIIHLYMYEFIKSMKTCTYACINIYTYMYMNICIYDNNYYNNSSLNSYLQMCLHLEDHWRDNQACQSVSTHYPFHPNHHHQNRHPAKRRKIIGA